MSTSLIPVVILAALVIGALGVLLHAVFIAPLHPRVTEVTASIPQLAPQFDGYTIVVLADPHYGLPPWSGRAWRQRVVDAVERADADLVALLGDYGVSFKRSRLPGRLLYPPAMAAMTPMLRSLRARDGMVAVLGNHDYFHDAPAVVAWLTHSGATVLVNDHVCIERDGAVLVCAGVDDAKEGRVDPAAGCASVPAELPRVILSHNPDGVLHFAPETRADLVLAGHTHGGQVVFPGFGAPLRLARICGPHTARGWIPNPRAPLYVSAGLGTVIPFRFNCAPEIVVVRLTPC
jgi:predicted MPP superfamily phosphohydrolase